MIVEEVMGSGAMLAVFDLGTSSTRLLIVDEGRQEHRRIETMTRLGDGLRPGGELLPEAMARTLDCLRAYQLVCADLGVTRRRVVATAAARDASNTAALLDAVEGVLGVRPELLSGSEEGRLAFAGASSVAESSVETVAVVDIGGGSTELIVGVAGREPDGVWSLPIGAARLSQELLHRDPPTAEELSGAVGIVHAHLDDAQREIPVIGDATRLIGVSGSVCTAAAVEIGVPVHDRARIHGFELTRTAAEDVFRTLATEPRADRAHNPGLPSDRVDTIVAGVLILVTVMRHFGFDGCTVSTTDLLDGLVASM